MRSLLFTFLLCSVFVISACNNNSDNPASANNVLKGTWKLSYYGNQNDTLNVSLNIDGTDNKLGGTGNLDYVEHNNGAKFTFSTTSGITGSYSADSINGAIGSDFKFSGKKSGNNYVGNASLVRATDTLYISNITYISSN